MIIRLVPLGVLFFLGLAVWGCERRDPGVAAGAKPESQALGDTAENRRQTAEKIVDSYSASEFGADLAERAEGLIGKEVVEEARRRFKARVTGAELRQRRIDLLVKNFTAPELVKLSELYANPDGRALLKKFPVYDEDLKSLISPMFLEVLTNKPQG